MVPGGDANQNPVGFGGGNWFSSILRMIFLWFVFNWISGNMNPAKNASPEDMLLPKFGKGTLVDITCYIDDSPESRPISQSEEVWRLSDVPLASSLEFSKNLTYSLNTHAQNNGTVYLHMVLSRSSHDIDIRELSTRDSPVFKYTHPLTVYLPKPKDKVGHNLLSKDAKSTEISKLEPDLAGEFVNFWKPNMTISFVDHFLSFAPGTIPPTVSPYLLINAMDKRYRPVVYFNEFWLLRDKLIPLNDSVSEVPLTLFIGPISTWYWQIQLQMEKSFEMQTTTGISAEGEKDEIKRIFLEGNPYLLAITMVVSLFHTVFDMLAFKNDIGFWKNNKSMEGLSARSVIINAFSQLVILLYLIDNETSYVVLFSSFLGTAIEFWKVTKAMHVSIDMTRFPYIRLADRASYSHKKTKQYDEEAMRYLSYVLYPLVGGYAIYSLYYNSHKSWYSWIISSLVGAVYMFGFILMCPQLYLNYRLKSVAHLPWRQMTYKFLNTIIDDLFAFVIKMPLLHRLSVFRDDIVFLVFLYQRWIYRVDKTRVNEFGYAEEEGPQELEPSPSDAPSQLALDDATPDNRENLSTSKQAGEEEPILDVQLDADPGTSMGYEHLRQRRKGDDLLAGSESVAQKSEINELSSSRKDE